jgi:hypothetical protein
MVSAGRILLMPRGAYDNNTPYEILDLVSYNGSSYVAKGPTKGNLPTDTTYWQLSAYGGNAANVAGNFAVIETTSVATVQHLEGTLFVDESSQFMKATQTINVGDSIVSGTNCTPTTVEQLINEVTAYVDGLDSRNRKLHGVTEIAAQTDLHGLALGEYYKDKTTFYVTNAPVGIANVPSAVFRLTVEAGSQDASLTNSPLLLTLRTLDGKTYTQGFDGNNWGAWIEAADQASTNSAISAVAASVEATQDSIAPVESATATSAHLAGSQLYYNDVLYDVTANISIGDNLADGVNIQAASESITEHFSSEIQTLTNHVDENLASINILKSSGNWRTGLRFKNLGTSFTAEQATALANGDFSEFWNGDYWAIDGYNWRIVDNSGWARRRGDTNFDSNSLVVMPDDNLVLAEAYLIDGGTSGSNTDTHGYANCGYRTDEKSGKGRTRCKTLFQNAFGSSHIASHRELMSTSRGTGGVLSWAWQDADVELPSEVNIYGHSVWGSGLESGIDEPSFNIGDRWGQFMLFRLAPYMAINRGQNYWLRDIHSASVFALVDSGGGADCLTPSNTSVGLRPYSIIK